MIILLFLLPLLSYGIFNLDLPPLLDEKCSFSRKDAYSCFKTYVDADKSNSIDKEELNAALKKYIPSKTITWALSYGIDWIFDDCDYNGDGILSPRDYKMSEKTCMTKQNHLCTIKWFCDKAREHKKE